jgi:tetratricopeptide (TPR) repeat protein
MCTTLAWSFGLLTAEEQRLFRRLAVFVGGCTLEAAEHVCVLPQHAEPLTLDLLEGLDAMIEKSLLRREENVQAEPRLGMLQVVREYALEQLEASADEGPVRSAHAYYYLRLAEQAEPELRGPEQWVWLEQLEREHDNLRAALGWLRTQADGELALRLAGALPWFWWLRGHFQEGLAWLEGLLVQLPDPDAPKMSRAESREDPDATRATALRAHALFGAAWLHFALDGFELARSRLEESIELWRHAADERGLGRAQALLAEVILALGNHIAARALGEEALARCRRVGDNWGVAWALEYLGHMAVESGDYTAAERWLTESIAGFQALGDIRGMTASLSFLAHAAYQQRRFYIARTCAEQGLSVVRSLGSAWLESLSLGLLAEIARAEGDHAQARAMAEETLRVAHELGAVPALPWTLRNLGYVDLAQGNPAAAISRLGEALGLFHRHGARLGVACCVAGLAGASAATGRYEHAARLLGASQALLDVLGMRLAPADSLAYEHTLATTRTALGDVAFSQEYAAGLVLAEAEAIALALDERVPG